MAAAVSKSALEVIVDVPIHLVDPRILFVVGLVRFEALVQMHHFHQRFPDVGKAPAPIPARMAAP